MSRLIRIGIVVAALAPLAAPTAAAQTAAAWQPPRPTNLKVVPADVDPARLVGLMRSLTVALGVGCQHCHASSGDNPADLSTFDFASDAVPAKAVARRMMDVTQRINSELLRDIGAPRPAGQLKVGCYTCHRGSRVPATAPAAPQRD